jgi:hypothetical protein
MGDLASRHDSGPALASCPVSDALKHFDIADSRQSIRGALTRFKNNFFGETNDQKRIQS